MFEFQAQINRDQRIKRERRGRETFQAQIRRKARRLVRQALELQPEPAGCRLDTRGQDIVMQAWRDNRWTFHTIWAGSSDLGRVLAHWRGFLEE